MPVGSGRRTATVGRSVPGEQRGYAMNFVLSRAKNASARDAPGHTNHSPTSAGRLRRRESALKPVPCPARGVLKSLVRILSPVIFLQRLWEPKALK